jgi:hypothetical protein
VLPCARCHRAPCVDCRHAGSTLATPSPDGRDDHRGRSASGRRKTREDRDAAFRAARELASIVLPQRRSLRSHRPARMVRFRCENHASLTSPSIATAPPCPCPAFTT